MVLSLSPGPAHVDMAYHYTSTANMWRITDDFWDKWDLLKNMFWRCEQWQDHVSEGTWPDCDMLPIGKLGKGHGHEWYSHFTDDELKTMMTLWCIFRSPLMIGTDLPQIDEKTLKLLTNVDVLEMLGDGRGVQIRRTDNEAVWKSVGEHCARVALFNLSDEAGDICVSVEDVCKGINLDTCKELWGEDTAKISDGVISAAVPAHGVRCFRFDK